MFRIADMRYAPGEVHQRHGHDELRISMVLRGHIDEYAAGVRYRASAGDVVVKPPGLMHADVFHGARMLALVAVSGADERSLLRYRWHSAAPSTAAGIRLAQRFLEGRHADEDIDDFVATIPSPITGDVRLARRAGRMIQDTFMTPVSVHRLAEDLGVHRVYLARVFRLQWGCSPRDYIQHLRVRVAAAAVASTRRALSEIALDAGFADQAHMTRAFVRRFGVPPGVLRRLVQP